VRICVIFNPTAKGEKAKHFRHHLDQIGSQASLKLTTGPDDARRLAAEAVTEGFGTVVAAGGDGTVNEVLNGLADAPEGFERTRLAVLPLGTVNVFARELAVPLKLEPAWRTILQGRETRIDLPSVEYRPVADKEKASPPPGQAESTMPPRSVGSGNALPQSESRRRHFAQLAGAGLDARAVELVNWPLKKRIGMLAYIVAGLQALLGAPFKITAAGNNHSATGGLVLIGNGRLYGGNFRVFPQANLNDGLLDVCVLPRVNWVTLIRCGPQLLLRGTLPASATEVFQSEAVTLTCPLPAPLELDGEWIGYVPARFSIVRSRLRVVVP
jgi:YegS/Rv2252/BmrU family lipid kinase